MKKKELENRINQAFTNSTPEVLDTVVAKLGNDNTDNIIDFRTRRRRSPVRAIAAAAAAVAVVIGLSLGAFDYLIPTAAVSLDVNPSIEMKINSREHIVSCTAANEDAIKILDGMDLRGTDIDVAVNALIGSMLKNGYLNELKNSVLITVTDPALQQRLTAEISDLLDASLGTSAVMSQTLPAKASSSGSDLAAQHGISEGKAALINEIIAADSTLSFDELAKLPVNDLNLLAQTRHSEQSSITTVGTASSKAYIGTDAAKAAAEKAYPGARFDGIELDCCDGVMAYEVEFIHDGFEYELEIDAVSGKIIKTEKEKLDDDDDDIVDEVFDNDKDEKDDEDDEREDAAEEREVTNAFSDAKITEEQAIEKALAAKELTRDEVKHLEVEKDVKKGKPIYKVEFERGSRDYEIEIYADTGEVVTKPASD